MVKIVILLHEHVVLTRRTNVRFYPTGFTYCGVSFFHPTAVLFYFDHTCFLAAVVVDRASRNGSTTTIIRRQEVRRDAPGNPKTTNRHVPAGGAEQQPRHLQLLDGRDPWLLAVVSGASKHDEEAPQVPAVVLITRVKGSSGLVREEGPFPPAG